MGDKLVRVFDEIPAFGFGIIGGDFSPRNDMAYADGFEYKAYFNKKPPEVKGKMPEELSAAFALLSLRSQAQDRTQ